MEQETETARVKIRLAYQYRHDKIEADCEGLLGLRRKGSQWLVDFSSNNFACAYSNAGASGEAAPFHQPHSGAGDSQLAAPAGQAHGLGAEIVPAPLGREGPSPVRQEAPPPAAGRLVRTQAAVSANGVSSLLDTWPGAELEGQPGDERIVKLQPPDHSPPQRTQTTWHLPKLATPLYGSIRRVRLPEGRKLVALTFDLCEQADDRTGYDRNIVNYLRGQQVPATFFAGGKWMRSHEDKALQLMADPLFELGNHGWTHGNLRVLKGQRMLDQITWTQAEYERIWEILNRRAKSFGLEQEMTSIPRQPKILRFPYGVCGDESLKAVNDLGLGAIQWDVVSGDAGGGVSADALANWVVGQVRPGSIVVFHANGRGKGTAVALPRIVSLLKEKGFSFANVSALLREGTPEVVTECYETRPGDNRRYDVLFGEGTE